MTFAIVLLLGSMFGARVGFMTAGVVRARVSGDAETPPYVRHPESNVPLVPLDR
jgi:hypothetical protein